MTSFSQSPCDRILWTLANNGGRMARSRLRACIRDEICITEPILQELVKGGRIEISNEIIVLI